MAERCTCGQQPHATRDVWNPRKKTMVAIDEQLALLICQLWDKGVRTWTSCQGEPGKMLAYIAVEDADVDLAEHIIGGMYIHDRNTTHDLGVVTIRFDHARLHLGE